MTTTLKSCHDHALNRRLELLRDLLPEAFCDGQLDVDRLCDALGQPAPTTLERYGLHWVGRAEAVSAATVPSTTHVTAVPQLSVDGERTAHLLVEADNLDALKRLLPAYGGQVKMIYIDPPYNTGRDFLYKDNFRDAMQDYLRTTGQENVDGAETVGRLHSRWLSMIYPRLVLARQMLRQDGVLFVSIGDVEVHNLRLLLDEVFGPSNFVATVIWQKVYSPKNSARHFSQDHDYILVYARDGQVWRPAPLPRTSKQAARYHNPDKDPRGPWKGGDLSARNPYSLGTYSITCPSGRVIAGPPKGTYWRVSREKLRALDADGRIWWGAEGNNSPAIKRFLSEVREGRVPQTLWTYEEVGHTHEAKRELLQRVRFSHSDNVFDTPKPTRLIGRMLQLATTSHGGDLVMDFFAGSGTTGEAVYKANVADGGNRRFILVQCAEATQQLDHPTISLLAAERLRTAGRALREQANADQDLGFRFLRMGDGPPDVHDSLLRAGIPCNVRLEKQVDDNHVCYVVPDHHAVVFMDGVVDRAWLERVVRDLRARVVVVPAACFTNDKEAEGAYAMLADRGVQLRLV